MMFLKRFVGSSPTQSTPFCIIWYDVIMTTNNIAWCAGVLEGEGSFLLNNKNNLVISCQMTDLDVLERLQDYLGAGKIYSCAAKQSHWKPSWVLKIQGKQARQIMTDLLPWMLQRRREKIEFCIRQHDLKNEAIVASKDKYFDAAKEYMNSNLSLRQVAEKHGVSVKAIRKYSNLL